MCDSDPLAEYAQEEEPVDLMQRAQVKISANDVDLG